MPHKIPTTHIIETERCILRYPSKDDIPHIWSASRFEGFNDGMKWDAPASIEELEQPLIENHTKWENGTDFSWSIVSGDDGEFIGRISIRQEEGMDQGSWSIGYWVHPTQQRKGYASEAARAIVGFGFEMLEAEQITADHAKWNEQSGTVLLNIGMQLIGETDQGFMKNGEWVSEYEYAISRERYLSLQK